MLARHIFGYFPSLLVTALVSFATVSLFTTWMTRWEYGQYSLLINAMTMAGGITFYWLQSALSRLMPEAIEKGTEKKLFSTLYALFLASSMGLLVIGFLFAENTNLADWRIAAWFAAPLAVMRGLLNLNQALHRNAINIKRYNIIEAGQSVIGLAVGMVLIIFLGLGTYGAAIGILTGLAVMAIFDWNFLKKIAIKNIDKKIFGEIVHFGAPFIVTFGLSFIVSGSDRFLIEHFLGPDQVGIYSAGYAFPDRIGQNIFMLVASASFPLLIRKLEKEGAEAAHHQTYINGVALLAISIPACAGMLLVNKQLAASLIGQNFREGAAAIMPWISVATILNGIAAHYFDHAFHLAKRTRLFFLTLGPAALLNFFGNLYTIPHFGIIGAAYTTLASYALYLFLSITIGRRVFKVRFPFKVASQITMCTFIMAIILLSFPFPQNFTGLIEMCVIGFLCYGLSIYALDIPEAKGLFKNDRHNLMSSVPDAIGGGLNFKILKNFAEISALEKEWDLLWMSSGNFLFGRYKWLSIWWKTLGSEYKHNIFFVSARSATGELIALVPLCIRKKLGIRYLEWAGQEVFDYGDIVANSHVHGRALWDFVLRCELFDILLLKEVRTDATAKQALESLTLTRGRSKAYFLSLEGCLSCDWLASQSRKFRGDIRRKTEKLAAAGLLTYGLMTGHSELPSDIIDGLISQKLAWLQERKIRGIFNNYNARSFLYELAKQASESGELYLAWMKCGDKLVACHFGFIRSNTLYLYHTSFDIDFASFSPGNLMMVRTIQNAIGLGLTEIDFMRGDETYKQRFASGFRELITYVRGTTFIGRIVVMIDGVLRREKGLSVVVSPHNIDMS